MPKSSKETGRTKSLEIQKSEMSSRLTEILESKKDIKARIHELARLSVKIKQDVIEAIGIKSYEFKSDVISSIDDPTFIYDEDKSFESYTRKTKEFLEIFVPKKGQTVSAYISQYQEYLPAEIKSLMIATGSIDIGNCDIELVKQSIKMHVDYCDEIEFNFMNLCVKAFSGMKEGQEIIESYYPKIKWAGKLTAFGELITILKKYYWIEDDNSLRHFAKQCHFHFRLIDRNSNPAKAETVKQELLKQQELIYSATADEIETIKDQFIFNPLHFPKNE